VLARADAADECVPVESADVPTGPISAWRTLALHRRGCAPWAWVSSSGGLRLSASRYAIRPSISAGCAWFNPFPAHPALATMPDPGEPVDRLAGVVSSARHGRGYGRAQRGWQLVGEGCRWPPC
jgi:hypothetical protein